MGLFSWLFKPKKENVVQIQEPIIKEEEKIMGQKLTREDFKEIANNFGLHEAYIRAIFTVEAGGKSGFLKEDSTIPVTLEEGHIFYKYLKQKGINPDEIRTRYPSICYPTWTKAYYKKGLAEYDRYLIAKAINEECAMLATSWGIGQIMGFNYKAAGYKTVKEFVNAMYESEKNQLMAMCNFIKSNKSMYEALKNQDWAKFARLYNGSGYAANKYDEKLQKAYEKYKNIE